MNKLINNLVLALQCVLTAAVFELLLFKPEFASWLVFVLGGLLLVGRLVGANFRGTGWFRYAFWSFFLLCWFSFVLFFTWPVWLGFALNLGVAWGAYYYWQKPEGAKLGTNNFFEVVYYIGFFLCCFCLLSLLFRLFWPFWLVLGMLAVLCFGLCFGVFKEATKLKTTWVLSLFVALICAESFLVLGFWPLSFLAKSLVLLVVFYSAFGMVWNYIQGKLTKRYILTITGMGLVVLLVLFMVAKWLPFVQ